MPSLRIKNLTQRPRVFSVVNSDGVVDSIRLGFKESIEIDSRLLTPEIVTNIKLGHLLILNGKLPEELSPFKEKDDFLPKKNKITNVKEATGDV